MRYVLGLSAALLVIAMSHTAKAGNCSAFFVDSAVVTPTVAVVQPQFVTSSFVSPVASTSFAFVGGGCHNRAIVQAVAVRRRANVRVIQRRGLFGRRRVSRVVVR